MQCNPTVYVSFQLNEAMLGEAERFETVHIIEPFGRAATRTEIHRFIEHCRYLTNLFWYDSRKSDAAPLLQKIVESPLPALKSLCLYGPKISIVDLERALDHYPSLEKIALVSRVWLGDCGRLPELLGKLPQLRVLNLQCNSLNSETIREILERQSGLRELYITFSTSGATLNASVIKVLAKQCRALTVCRFMFFGDRPKSNQLCLEASFHLWKTRGYFQQVIEHSF